MRAAVAQAKEASGIVEHLIDRGVIARYIVHDREIEILAPAAGDVIVSNLVGRPALARGNRGDAFLRHWLVIRRVAHDTKTGPPARPLPAALCPLGGVG